MTETEIGSIVNRFCASPRPMLIGDQWLEATDGGIIDVVDPATGQAFASVHAAGAAERPEPALQPRRGVPAVPHDAARLQVHADDSRHHGLRRRDGRHVP